MMINFSPSLSALNAFSIGHAVTANNIANINTDEFDPSTTVYEEQPDSNGVRVQEIDNPEVQGPLIASFHPVETPAGVRQESLLVEGSATELTTEIVNMITTQRTFEANAAVVRTNDSMLGTLLDTVI